MNAMTAVRIIMTSLHNLATVAWIGGLIAATVSVLPALKGSGLNPQQTLRLTRLYWKRQRVLSAAAIIILAVSGVFLTKVAAVSVKPSVGAPYTALLTIKHVLSGLMLVLVILRTIMDRRTQMMEAKAEPARPDQSGSPAAAPKGGKIPYLVYANTAAGVIVIILSSILAVLSRLPR